MTIYYPFQLNNEFKIFILFQLYDKHNEHLTTLDHLEIIWLPKAQSMFWRNFNLHGQCVSVVDVLLWSMFIVDDV